MAHSLKVCRDAKYLPSTFSLCVRWLPTKPRWVPVAKTKQFRVIPRPQEEFLGETVECKRLYNNYKTHFRGALELLRTMYKESEVSQDVVDAQEKEEADCWREALRINQEWNRRIAIEREELDRQQFENEVLKAQEKMSRADEEKRKEQERIDNLIREQEELSKSFITPDKLDDHVEKILNSKPHSFNYALDLEGNVYDDFSPSPTRRVTENGEFVPLTTEEEHGKGRTRRRS